MVQYVEVAAPITSLRAMDDEEIAELCEDEDIGFTEAEQATLREGIKALQRAGEEAKAAKERAEAAAKELEEAEHMDRAWSVLVDELGLEEAGSELERTKTVYDQRLAAKDEELEAKGKELEDEREAHAQEIAQKDAELEQLRAQLGKKPEEGTPPAGEEE